jgi:putative membrane protein
MQLSFGPPEKIEQSAKRRPRDLSKMIVLIYVSFSLLAGGWAAAQMTNGSSSPDGKFAAAAASGGMAEVKLGHLAQQNGSSDAVKSFGKQMVTDHSKVGDDLKSVAQTEGMTLPMDMAREDQETYDHLSQLHGAQFDKEYAQDMVTDHQKDIADFQKEASSGKDASLKDFANRTLPTLKNHLRMAQDMERKVSASSGY